MPTTTTTDRNRDTYHSSWRGVIAVLDRHGPVTDAGGHAVAKLARMMRYSARPVSLGPHLRELEGAGVIKAERRGRRTFSISLVPGQTTIPAYVPLFGSEDYHDMIAALAVHFGGTLHRDDLPGTGDFFSGRLARVLGIGKTYLNMILHMPPSSLTVERARAAQGWVLSVSASESRRTWAYYEEMLREYDGEVPRLSKEDAVTGWKVFRPSDALEARDEDNGGDKSYPAPVERAALPDDKIALAQALLYEVLDKLRADTAAIAEPHLREAYNRGYREAQNQALDAATEAADTNGETVSAEDYQRAIGNINQLRLDLDTMSTEVTELREKNSILEHNLAVMRRSTDKSKGGGYYSFRDHLSDEDRKVIDKLMREIPAPGH